MILFYSVLHGFLGLIIGSFLNVVIYRVARGESIVAPSSHCPECGCFLRPWELIPVFGYLLLGGKCGKCGIKISRRYPIVELLTGVLFVLTYYFRPERTMVGIIFDLIFVSLLIALTFIDIDTFRLPDVLVVFVAGIALLNTILTDDPLLYQSIGGAIGVGGVFLMIAFFYSEGMGWGDVKFVAALGLYLGFPDILIAVFIASFFGVIIGGIRMLVLKKDLKDPIPFGPFLAGGALAMLIFSNQIFKIFYS